MRNMNLRMLAFTLTVFCLPALGRATAPQEAAETKQVQQNESGVYRVEYTVRELEDGKKLNSRKCTLMLSRDPTRPRVHGMIRSGSNVPTGRAEDAENKGRVQYAEVGIKIDCDVREREKGVGLDTNFESSYVPEGSEGVSRIADAPIIRQVRFSSESFVALDKPTVIGTVDDVMTTRRYEIEVTVTKMK